MFAPGASARPTPFYARLVRQAGRRPAVDRSAPAGGALREMIAAAPVNRRAKVMLDHVRSEATRVLGLPASQPLDDRQPLHERGLDSLMAVELRNALGRSLECRLPATLLFDYPTPEALASHLLTVVVPESPKDVPVVEPPDVVSIVDELSDEEVDRLFAERMGKKA
jgi:acyl carrier protein